MQKKITNYAAYIFMALAVFVTAFLFFASKSPKVYDASKECPETILQQVQEYCPPEFGTPENWRLVQMWQSDLFYAEYAAEGACADYLKKEGRDFTGSDGAVREFKDSGIYAPSWWPEQISSEGQLLHMPQEGAVLKQGGKFYFYRSYVDRSRDYVREPAH